ncbi:hypothetical protein INT43_004751 [Umbelopsis isabellina]|uniref:(d)CMP kinase n=1 Tax=Mortierella isabellina TaxID=91625 RepID=A0A8H7PEI8_MORIS|nr:hypothetical protein INT43_004751 [Umbelopsis isabellina]
MSTARIFRVAIDGPAASGKSTTAKLLAEKLSFGYIDSGAMYRAITLKCLRLGISPSDSSKATEIGKIAQATTITFPNMSSVVVDKTEDVSSEIRSSTITSNIGGVASNKSVREALAEMQRALARGDYPETFEGREGINHNGKQVKGMVMDGRDIGTVILPDAELKVFLIADAQVRAQRRYDEMVQRNKLEEGETVDKIKKELEQRDHEDTTRAVSPLKKADDAVELDTSNLTIPQQVEAIEELIRNRMDKFQ